MQSTERSFFHTLCFLAQCVLAQYFLAQGSPALASPAAAQEHGDARWIEPSHVLHVVEGEVEDGQLGYVVAALGDCDGDGVRDFAVGAPLHPAGGTSAGRVAVHSGATGARLFQRDGLKGDQLGMSVAGVGDANGDGRADLLVGAPQGRRGPGRVLVLSGANGDVLHTLGGHERGDRFGAAVAFVGDYDGDGADDFAVGAPGRNVPRSDPDAATDSLYDAGAVVLYSGRDGTPLAQLEGERYRGQFGVALDGELGRDRRDAQRLLVVGEAGDGRRTRARVSVFRGAGLAPAFHFDGGDVAPGLGGGFLSLVGDVDADGVPDVYASDWRSAVHGDLTGLVLVHSGRTGEQLLRLTGEKADDGFGTGDGRVGDVDGDGHDDLLVGAWLAGEAAEKGGRVQLFSGADGRELRRWTGTEAEASLGFDTAGVGDVDGDGLLDFLFSAATCDLGPDGRRADAGAVYLVSGAICDPGEHLTPEPIDLPTMEDANELLRHGRFEAAAGAFERIARARPDEARAWFLLGLSLHYEGRYEEALAAHLRAAQFPGLAQAATYNAACAHALLGNDDEAFALLRRTIEQGFDDLRHMEGDGDLAALRDDPRWAELMAGERAGAFLEADAVVLHELVGTDPGSQFGWALAVPGDCDGDGVDDVAVAAPLHEHGGAVVGRVDLFSGTTGAPLRHWLGTADSGFARSVAGVGDVDADGVPDLAVGAPGRRGAVGRVHVLSGADGAELFVVEGRALGDQFGRALAGVGDFDGDGRADLAVGAAGDGTSLSDDGFVVILSGDGGRELARVGARSANERFGSAVAGRFGDGQRLLVVGARDGGPGRRGRVYVYRDDLTTPALVFENDEDGADLGRQQVGLVADRDGDGLPEVLCSDWRREARGVRSGVVRVFGGGSGEELLRVRGRTPGEGLGIGIAVAGDLDGDGLEDIVAGAWTNQEGAVGGGKAYALSGRDGRVLATWTSVLTWGWFGSDVAAAGDLDGDGVPDLVVGAPSRSRQGERPGRVFVLSGAPARASAVEATYGPDGGR